MTIAMAIETRMMPLMKDQLRFVRLLTMLRPGTKVRRERDAIAREDRHAPLRVGGRGLPDRGV